MGLRDGFHEIDVVPSEGLSSNLEARPVRDRVDEVECGVSDRRHVRRTVLGAQAHEVVVKHDVQNPVEAVLDAPVGPDGAGELRGGQGRGREVVSAGEARPAATLDLGLVSAERNLPKSAV